MSGYGFKNTTDRHRVYLDLWDAFQMNGCPVCVLVEKRYRRDVDEIANEAPDKLGEDMTDRDPMHICNWHIRGIWAVGSSEIRRRIMEDALRSEERDLKDILLRYEESPIKLKILHKLRWGASPSNQLLRRMKSCRLCRNLIHTEEVYLKALLNHIADADFYAEFKRSAGICFPHVAKALAMFPYHKNLLCLIKGVVDKTQILRMELSESKHYYSQQEVEGAEIDLWQRLLEMIAGKQGDYPCQSQMGCEKVHGDNSDFLSPPLLINVSTEK